MSRNKKKKTYLKCLSHEHVKTRKTHLSPAGDTGSSVEGMVAVARIATKGSSVVDA
jgi:hypothetical protein